MATDNLISVSSDDRVLLIAIRDYVRLTGSTPRDVVSELYDLASQAISHRSEEVASQLDSPV